MARAILRHKGARQARQAKREEEAANAKK